LAAKGGESKGERGNRRKREGRGGKESGGTPVCIFEFSLE